MLGEGLKHLILGRDAISKPREHSSFYRVCMGWSLLLINGNKVCSVGSRVGNSDFPILPHGGTMKASVQIVDKRIGAYWCGRWLVGVELGQCWYGGDNFNDDIVRRVCQLQIQL
jgi:hypothetical protein